MKHQTMDRMQWKMPYVCDTWFDLKPKSAGIVINCTEIRASARSLARVTQHRQIDRTVVESPRGIYIIWSTQRSYHNFNVMTLCTHTRTLRLSIFWGNTKCCAAATNSSNPALCSKSYIWWTDWDRERPGKITRTAERSEKEAKELAFVWLKEETTKQHTSNNNKNPSETTPDYTLMWAHFVHNSKVILRIGRNGHD